MAVFEIPTALFTPLIFIEIKCSEFLLCIKGEVCHLCISNITRQIIYTVRLFKQHFNNITVFTLMRRRTKLTHFTFTNITVNKVKVIFLG